MRKLLFISLVLIAMSCVFSSCRKDDAEEEEITQNVGTFKVDGNVYKITQGVVQGHKSTASGQSSDYNFSFIAQEGDVSRIVRIAVYFPYNQEMNGNYTLEHATKGVDSFLSSYSVQTGTTMDSSNDLTQGTVTVKRNSTSNFTFVFSIKPSNGKTITGEFNGEAMVQEF